MNWRTLPSLAVACLAVSVLSTPTNAEDWTRFRGAGGTGVSTSAVPTTWSPSENVKWKSPLKGAGVSSPIIVGDKIFLTSYSGYGLDRQNPGDIENLKRHVFCISRTDGKLIWEKTIDAVQPEDPYSGMGVPAHGYASHTPVSDGKHVYVFLGKSGVFAYDLDGKELWQTSVGTDSDRRAWGSASSPVLYKNLVIVPALVESMAMIALDKTTGKEVWKEVANGYESCWGTPVIVNVDGRDDLVMGVPFEIWGMNPENGKLRWISKGVDNDSFYTSVAIENGTLYGSASGRSGGGSVAVKLGGGKGDLEDKNVVWEGRDGAGFGSPVVSNGAMFIFSRDIAKVLSTEDGSRILQKRLESPGSSGGGQGGGRRGRMDADYASPVVANDKVYYVKSSGATFVFSADKEFKQLAVNQVTEDQETFAATPAISDGQIFLRSNKHLYCVEAK